MELAVSIMKLCQLFASFLLTLLKAFLKIFWVLETIVFGLLLVSHHSL